MNTTLEIIDSTVSDPTWPRSDIQRIAFAADTYDDAAMTWHAFRGQYVGASDVGAILNKSPFTSPYEVWQHKTGVAQAYPDTEAMYWGRVQEPVVADEYQKRHPNLLVLSPLEDFGRTIVTNLHESEYKEKLQILKTPSLTGDDTPTPDRIHRFMYRNKDFKLAIASPDRIIVDKKTDKVWGLEIKTSASWGQWEYGHWNEPNSPNVIPYGYYLQILWSMMVLDMDRWDLAVLICGNTYREYTFFRNKDLETDIYNQIQHWWEAHVEGDVPPPMSGHDSLNRILRDAYPSPSRSYLQADKEVNEMMDQFVAEKENLETQSKEVEAIKQQLKSRIQNNRGVDGDSHIIDWLRYEQRRVGWKDLAHDIAREQLGTSEIPEEILSRWTKVGPQERFSVRSKAKG